MKNLFFKLAKVEAKDDGTLYVEGVASSEAKDAQGEIIKSDALAAAIPDFMKHGTGALREMHQPLAAGTVDSAIVEDGVTKIAATVVDPVAIKKVQTGVYKGFSIGGRALERDTKDRKTITKCSLTEISLVDRPANPDAVISLFKVEQAGEASEAVAKGEDAASADAKATEAGGAETHDAGDVAKGDASATDPDLSPMEKAAASAERLAALAAGQGTGEADPLAPFNADPIRKGMYQVSSLSDVVRNLAYLARSTRLEAEAEKDGSRIPARLLDALKGVGQILVDMTNEEVAELIAAASPGGNGDVYAYADVALDMVKAARELEAAAMAKGETPKQPWGALVEKAVDALGMRMEGDNEALAKVTAERDAAIAKAAAGDEAFAKLSASVDASLDALTKRLADVEGRVLPPKTAASTAATAISKGEDVSGQPDKVAAFGADDVAKALGAMDEDARALLITKAALRMGTPINR